MEAANRGASTPPRAKLETRKRGAHRAARARPRPGVSAGLQVCRPVPTVRAVLVLFLFALVLLAAWFIAVVVFHVAAAAIHILLAAALVLFAVGFMRRRFARPHRRVV